MNLKVKGIVKFAGKQDGKNILSLNITDEQAEKIEVAMIDEFKSLSDYESTPIKEDNQDESKFLKASSKWAVEVYENGKQSIDIEDALTFDQIGAGSEVVMFFGIKDQTYRKKKYLTAYLKKVNVLELEESVHYNPFEDDDTEEI